MLFLDSIKRADGATATPADINRYLLGVASSMYQRGWTIIGSRFKLPNLHPWKAPNRSELFSYAQNNLCSMRANSLNIRLYDTNTIALDCDFNDPRLMSAFVVAVMNYLNLPKQRIFTVSGLKGGKLFFSYHATNSTDGPPRSLGSVVFTQGHAGQKEYKQELEVKSDLSTIAGLYGPNQQGRMLLYGTYEDYPFIAQASPQDLPEITMMDLRALGRLYQRLVSGGGYVNQQGKELIDAMTNELLFSSVAYFYVQVRQALMALHSTANPSKPTQVELQSFVQNSSYYWQYLQPMFSSLGLQTSCDLIESLVYFVEKPLTIEQLQIKCQIDQLLHEETAAAQRYLLQQATFFVNNITPMTQRFYELGAQYGLTNLTAPPEIVYFELKQAMQREQFATT